MKVEGNNIIITAKQEIQESGGTRQQNLIFRHENPPTFSTKILQHSLQKYTNSLVKSPSIFSAKSAIILYKYPQIFSTKVGQHSRQNSHQLSLQKSSNFLYKKPPKLSTKNLPTVSNKCTPSHANGFLYFLPTYIPPPI